MSSVKVENNTSNDNNQKRNEYTCCNSIYFIFRNDCS